VVPIGQCCELSFLLPVGTPPNAIAYGTRWISRNDLLGTGAALSAVVAAALVLSATFYAPWVLGGGAQLAAQPWAVQACNVTASVAAAAAGTGGHV
jgi:solute carrier family 13 (sodium-dependent dicarboxylate transporter), member 2/3/5